MNLTLDPRWPPNTDPIKNNLAYVTQGVGLPLPAPTGFLQGGRLRPNLTYVHPISRPAENQNTVSTMLLYQNPPRWLAKA